MNCFPYLCDLSASQVIIADNNLDISRLKLTRLALREIVVLVILLLFYSQFKQSEKPFWKYQSSLISLSLHLKASSFLPDFSSLQAAHLTQLQVTGLPTSNSSMLSVISKATKLVELEFMNSGYLNCLLLGNSRFPYLNILRLRICLCSKSDSSESISNAVPGMFPSITSLVLRSCDWGFISLLKHVTYLEVKISYLLNE